MTAVKLTFDEFLQQRDTKPASEFACGEVYQKPMPDGPHSALQVFLTAMLFPFLQRTGLGRTFTELRCIFGPVGHERVYVQDVVVVSNDKLPIPRHLHAAPDLAVEVLSPDQHMTQIVDKVQFYLLHGVRLVWVIDPATQTITIQMPGQEGQILGLGDRLDGGAVLPGFELSVEEIFAQMPL